jgi:predicted metalloprotease with PDZ domain
MRPWMLRSLILFILTMALSAGLLHAQSTAPASLFVDATQAPEHILHTKMVLPVKPGPLTLYYPKWIPGEHEASGPISNVAGLKFTANGQVIPWRRDLLDVYTFHLEIPQGVSQLQVQFDYIEPGGGGFSFGASATDKLVIISWNQNVLYPAGVRAQDFILEPRLTLPQGWKYGTALLVAGAEGNSVTFKPLSLNRLVDSPVVAGEYFRAVDVTPPGEPIHHEIDLVADSQNALNMSPELQKDFTNLVAESGKLFGARHYRDYHFLLTLSNHVAHFGLEHHESDDSRIGEDALLTQKGRRGLGSLLPHEFVHSWNGKFRRPADLSTPYYEAPEKTDLLWVYEGLTDFLGPLLATRSGIWTPEQYREYLASIAAGMGPGRPGRTWRPLQDTADAEPGVHGIGGWVNWKRSVDYYPEGDLLWLEVATIIHDRSQGQKSIEDFCHLFYGGPNNGPQLKTYTFDDLVKALNQVTPYDWAGFFHKRLTSTSPEAPVGGIEAAGWKVVYTEKAPKFARGGPMGGGVNAIYSIGLRVSPDGTVTDSIVGGPAYKAGVTAGMKVKAVNSRAYTPDLLHAALKATATSNQPIQLLLLNDDYYKTCTVYYHGGERYPHLLREEAKPDYLDELAKPLAKPQ